MRHFPSLRRGSPAVLGMKVGLNGDCLHQQPDIRHVKVSNSRSWGSDLARYIIFLSGP